MGIDVPKIEIRYEHLNIQGEVHLGTRAIPTLPNAVINIAEVYFYYYYYYYWHSCILYFLHLPMN